MTGKLEGNRSESAESQFSENVNLLRQFRETEKPIGEILFDLEQVEDIPFHISGVTIISEE